MVARLGVVAGFVVVAVVAIVIINGSRPDAEQELMLDLASIPDTVEQGHPLVPPGEPLRDSSTSTPLDPEGLSRRWSRGPFERFNTSGVAKKLEQHLKLDARTPLDEIQQQALRAKLAAFLTAYGHGKFEDYLAFRPLATLAGDDDSRVAAQVKAIQDSWVDDIPGAPPEPPADRLGLLKMLWTFYVSTPPIAAINWKHCRVVVRALPAEQFDAAEWDEQADRDAHFRREFEASCRASRGTVFWRAVVPNRTSAAEIVKRDPQLIFADFEIMIRDPDRLAFPVLVRLIWDADQQVWLAMHGATLDQGNCVFIF